MVEPIRGYNHMMMMLMIWWFYDDCDDDGDGDVDMIMVERARNLNILPPLADFEEGLLHIYMLKMMTITMTIIWMMIMTMMVTVVVRVHNLNILTPPAIAQKINCLRHYYGARDRGNICWNGLL